MGEGGFSILLFKNDTWLALFRFVWVIFIVFDAALFVVFVVVWKKGLRFRPRIRPGKTSPPRAITLRDALVRERWNAIVEKARAGGSDAAKIAIIEADKLVDDSLKQMGLQGEHMADRLAQVAPEELHSLERLRRAHRIRNDLVHTPGFTITAQEAEQTLLDYQSFLKESKTLDS